MTAFLAYLAWAVVVFVFVLAMHVNDHGNVSLYVANGGGKLREVWSLV